MKIYRLMPNCNYRFMYPEKSIYKSLIWEFNSKSLKGVLPQFKAHFDQSSTDPIPDIAYLGMTTFAFKKDVAEKMGDILERAGELLPFYVGDDLWYCLNVLESLDALDEENSKYKYDDGEIKLDLVIYAFDESKLSDSSLFKIPNDNHTDIFCIDRGDTGQQNIESFFSAVNRFGFTGVEFKEVYSSD